MPALPPTGCREGTTSGSGDPGLPMEAGARGRELRKVQEMVMNWAMLGTPCASRAKSM